MKVLPSPLVSIVYGSDSDLPIMRQAIDFLVEMGVPYETTIVSAHRTPKKLYEFAESAANRGIKVIIAGAGGAAHLPGMLASITPLPVIGVPIRTNALSGLDSLYSIVQMPPGIPVATMAINGAKNAGILALSILGTSCPTTLQKISAYKKSLDEMVQQKCKKIDDLGYDEYIKGM